MHRIVKRVVSLSAAALFAGAGIAACASEEPTYDSKVFEQGGCVEEFCPRVPGGRNCCLPNPLGGTMCGSDLGMGCVPAPAKDAG